MAAGAPVRVRHRPPRGIHPAAALGSLAARARATVLVDVVLLAGAVGCWIDALLRTDPRGVSGWGLLAALPATYFVGLGLLTVGFALAASGPRVRPAVLMGYVVALAVILHATAAILYPEARYTWTYKHVGVIDYVMAHGQVDRSIDIYQNWPGFFALNAWLSKTAGISPLSYARWAQVFFALAGTAAVVFAVRGLTRDPRRVWTTAWLFLVANWIGQEYLAPQAFGFVVVIVLVGLVLRASAWGPPPRTRLGWALVRLENRIAAAALRGRRPSVVEQGPVPVAGWACLVLGGACYLAAVVSHQLSPAMAIAGVAAVTVVRRRPRLWVLAAMVAVEVWWLELGYGFVSRHFKLFEFEPSASARGTTSGLEGVALGASLSRVAILATILLAVVGLVRRLRAGHWDATALALACAPGVVMLLQSYGGEGPLRAYLFALPWLAWFGAAACAGRSWRLVAATAVIGGCSLFGYFGQEPLNYVTGDDVAASRWYLDKTPEAARISYLAPNFPDRVTANYVKHLDEPRDLLTMPIFRLHLSDPASCAWACGPLLADDVARFLRRERAPEHFVVASPSQKRYLRYHAVGPPSAYDSFVRALRESPRFQVAFRRGDAWIFKLIR